MLRRAFFLLVGFESVAVEVCGLSGDANCAGLFIFLRSAWLFGCVVRWFVGLVEICGVCCSVIWIMIEL